MDVIDAGVYVSKWEARVPKHAKVTLWGPLQAKEMGLDGWEVQDGGETGFVMHNAGVRLTMGRATSTLIFVRRLQSAFLTVYFGGYPADAPAGQRKLDMQKVVAASELFLTRIAKEPVKFEFQGELSLVDNSNDAALPPRRGAPAAPKAIGGGKLSRSADIIDADDELAKERSALVPPEHRRKAAAEPLDPDAELARKAGYVTAKEATAKGEAVRGKPKAVDAEVVKKDGKGRKGTNEVWEV
ncbi:MAG TPA: hypothetical protein VM327_00560 [Candidatus Thermoplasmatota archaeon]|nr:hypothetical protein [Candidatus Thermoplasmatota archaeon]